MHVCKMITTPPEWEGLRSAFNTCKDNSGYSKWPFAVAGLVLSILQVQPGKSKAKF